MHYIIFCTDVNGRRYERKVYLNNELLYELKYLLEHGYTVQAIYEEQMYLKVKDKLNGAD